MAGGLSIIDYLIVIAYLAGTVILGVAIGRKMRTGKDYFLGGRALPWWAIGMSLVATDIGATDIIGVGGASYSFGLAVANFEWIGCIPSMIIAAFIFIPFFWRASVYTIPEYMEKRFNAKVRVAMGLCWILFMACNIGLMLYASSKMSSVLFGWNTFLCILLMASLICIYTVAGGLSAVVYTDTIQCSVMIGGCLLILVLGVIDLGGVGELFRQVKEIDATSAYRLDNIDHTALILPVDTKSPFPWTAILIGLGLIQAPAYWIGNQAIVQRALGAKSEFAAKASFIWGALLKNFVPVVVAVPGLIALVKFPELRDGDTSIPELIAHLLPPGLRGLFLAAFLAALMSSVDSYLNSASTMLTSDLYKRFLKPSAGEGDLLKVGRWTTAGLVVWGILFAMLLSQVEEMGIYAIFQTLMAFIAAPSFALILSGILWKRTTGAGALSGFLSGLLCSILLFVLNQEPVYTLLGFGPLFRISDPFLYLSIWAFLVSVTVIVVVSLFTPREPEEKIANLVYRRTSRS